MKIGKWLAAVGAISLIPMQLLAMNCYSGPMLGVDGEFIFSSSDYTVKYTYYDLTGQLYEDDIPLKHDQGGGIYVSLGYRYESGFSWAFIPGYRVVKDIAKDDSEVTLESHAFVLMAGLEYAWDFGYNTFQPLIGVGAGFNFAEIEGNYQVTDASGTVINPETGTYSDGSKTTGIAYIDLGFQTNLGLTSGAVGTGVQVKYRATVVPKWSDPKDIQSQPADTASFGKNGLGVKNVDQLTHALVIGLRFPFASGSF